jgi:hypothetical protein
MKSDNPQVYPPDFVMAFSFYLAFLGAPRLTGGDPFKLGGRALQLFAAELSNAAQQGFSEERPDEDIAEAEIIRARN